MTNAPPRVLALGISTSGCAQLLREQGFQVEQADEFSQGLRQLERREFDLVLVDLAESSGSGVESFVKTHTAAPHTPVIVLIEAANEDLGRQALHLGAQDYILRQALDGPALAQAVHKAIERHHSLEASRRDRHLLEILMNNIPDAIYFKDTESRFLRISRAHAKIFDLADPTLAIGKTDADFFSEAHARQAYADERQVMRSGQPLVGIEEMETWPDGSVTWVSTTKMPLRDPSGRIIGTFGISRNITKRKLAEQALAERTRQLQQKNQQIEEELKMARELQLAMLPQQFPRVPPHLPAKDSALEFCSFYFPTGAVSGDFFDVVELSETAVGLFICDVMGHDVRAALVTAMMRTLVKDLSQMASDPGQLLAQINRGLGGIFKQTGATMYATAAYLVVDVVSGELRYASAAHPDALLVRRSQGTVETLLTGPGKRGPALGLFEEAAFPTCQQSVNVGDMIMLFTDGLIEAEGANEECFTQERLAAAVRQRLQLPTKEMFNEVVGEIRRFCGQADFSDDVSMVGMEIKRLERPAVNYAL